MAGSWGAAKNRVTSRKRWAASHLTLEASAAVENAWRALTAVTDAQTAQGEAELGIDEDGD